MSGKNEERFLIFGKDVRNGLLRLAIDTRDSDLHTLSEWIANIEAYLRGHLDACMHQRDVVSQVCEIVGWTPECNKMLLSRLVTPGCQP